MRNIVHTRQFEKDVKNLVRAGNYKIDKLKTLIQLLEIGKPLPRNYKAHKLRGDKNNTLWECHIQSNWLLVYRISGNTVQLVRSGTHAETLGL